MVDIFGLPVKVDKFTGQAELFILSHFHRDHMSGLRKGWDKAPLLCSRTSANLLMAIENVPEPLLEVIDPDEEREFIIGGQKLRIKAIEANHCPGALMFVIDHYGRKLVYTGDFRLNDQLREQLHLLRDADRLYVDSTYAAPEYSFPKQEESVAAVVEQVRKNRHKEILLAIYTIGKTKLIEALYEEFGRPVYVSKDKIKAYEAMGYGSHVTMQRKDAGFVGYSRNYIDRYFRWKNGRTPGNCLVIYPSGMCNRVRRRPGFFYVEYSEHCDWSEYREFVESVDAKEIIQI